MVAAVVLAALVLAAGVSSSAGVGGALALATISVLWLLVNGPMEGKILVDVSATHGITGADLAGLVGLGLAAVQGARAFRRRERG